MNSNTIAKLLACAAAFAAAIPLVADTETVNGIEWNYTVSDGKAEICTGEWQSAIPTSTTGEIIVPSTLGGYPVTSIGHSAFMDCSGLTQVTISESVTNVGEEAFFNCTSLTNVLMPNVVSIGHQAFRYCSSLENVTFPNSMLSIGDRSFQDCSSLTNVVIPLGVLELRNCAFEGCVSLLGVNIPDTVTYIGECGAFSGCSSLLHVVLSQVAIERGMGDLFPNAYQTITSVSLSDNVTNIPSRAFDGCNEAIYNTTTIPGVKLVDGWAVGHVDGLSGVLDLTGVRGIAGSAFRDCELLTHVKIPATVKVIGESAFSGCRGLRSVEIAGSVTNIGCAAFESCDGLNAVVITDEEAWCRISFGNDSANPLRYAHNLYSGDALVREITVPFGTKAINDYLFCGCSCLTNVALPRGIRRIGISAFNGCSGLTEITVPSSVTNVGDYAFSGCEQLSRVNVGNLADWCAIEFGNAEANPLSRAHHLYVGGSLMTALVVPWDVTRIGAYAFSGCEDMVYAVLPAQVTDVGTCAFSYCNNLKWVYLLGNGDSFAVAPDIYSGTPESLVTFVPIGSTGWLFAGSTTLPDEWPSGYDARKIEHRTWNPETPPRTVTFVGNLESLYEGYDVLPVQRAVLNGMAIEDIPRVYDFYQKYYTYNSWIIDGSEWVKLDDDAYYTFKGWWTAAVGGQEVTTNTLVSSDMTCYAHWLKFYCVRFDPTGGGGCSGGYCYGDYIVTNGMALGSCPTVDREGYDFAGWWTAPDGGVRVTESTNVRASCTYYAHWIKNDDPVTPDPVTPDPVTPDPVNPDPVTPSYEVIEPGDIREAFAAPKAVVLTGAVYSGNSVVGIVELKLGKVNDRKQTGKVSGSVTTLDGKKHAAKAANLTGIDGTTPQEVALEVKDMGTMNLTIGGGVFAGSLGGKYHVQSADVGGEWTGSDTKVNVVAADSSLPTGTLKDLLPTGEPVVIANGKWKFHKAAKVKWAKPKKGAALPEIYDEASGKGLVIDTSAGKTNLSGMKLNCAPKKGTFKGSFKMYALTGEGKTKKLKKYTAKVSGVVVGGFGYGEATIKGFPPITVEIH